MDNEAVRVAVSLRLGLNLSHVHPIPVSVAVLSAHGEFTRWCANIMKHASGRFARHHALNDTISGAFVSAGIPALKEPADLSRSDGRRPDSLTIIPWQGGQQASQ